MSDSKQVPRPLEIAAGALLLVEAGVFGVFGSRVEYPVTFFSRELLTVNVTVGAVVVLVLAGIARVLGTGGSVRWAEFSLTASITVFLVAQLNGITDLAALVLVYAATSGMVLFQVVNENVAVGQGQPRLALWFAAALGIVPWGVIAFYEIGGSLLGAGPSVMARAITLAMLASAFAFFISQWRASSQGTSGQRMHVLLSVVGPTVLACLVVLGLG